MSIQTTFVRVTSIGALGAFLGVSLLGISGAQAKPAAQAAATVGAVTTMPSTMVATMSSDGAIPPCPQGMMVPTMASTMAGAMPATAAMMAPTMAAAMPATAAMMAPTMAATMAGPGMATMAPTMSGMSATMAATMFVMPGATMNGCVLTATLLGTNEVPKAGDPNGKGMATIMISRPDTGSGEICFNIQVSGIKLPAAASHIHAGVAGVAGPVVVPFQAPDASGNAVGCTENVDRALISSILAQPAAFYVNVHNADFPGGAMRGQLAIAGQ